MSVDDLFRDDPPLVLPTIKGLDAYIPQEEFFDSTLLDRIDKARPIPTNTTGNPKKPVNKAAQKLPKKFLKKPCCIDSKIFGIFTSQSLGFGSSFSF